MDDTSYFAPLISGVVSLIIKTYNGWGMLSHNLKCSKKNCSKDGDCTMISELCHIDDGCQAEFDMNIILFQKKSRAVVVVVK
ncbi:hypothetical protein U3516DRAFT_788913 [Neocallimastix sp. 'constans']